MKRRHSFDFSKSKVFLNAPGRKSLDVRPQPLACCALTGDCALITPDNGSMTSSSPAVIELLLELPIATIGMQMMCAHMCMQLVQRSASEIMNQATVRAVSGMLRNFSANLPDTLLAGLPGSLLPPHTPRPISVPQTARAWRPGDKSSLFKTISAMCVHFSFPWYCRQMATGPSLISCS